MDLLLAQAVASLALAMSMGELGATMMLFPPDWRTLLFLASSSTVLLPVTLLGVFAVGLLRGRAAHR